MKKKNTFYTAKIEELNRLTGIQIADRLKLYRNDYTSESEYRSWCHSIPALVSVIHAAGLDSLVLALEYETPIGGRIDAVLLGTDRNTRHNLAAIIELKQWTRIEPNVSQAESTVLVCLSSRENRYENRLHPVQQTLTYYKHLKENHSNVAEGKIDIFCLQYLHNFEKKDQLFEGLYQKYKKCASEMYVNGDEEKLVNFLKKNSFQIRTTMSSTCLYRENTALVKLDLKAWRRLAIKKKTL